MKLFGKLVGKKSTDKKKAVSNNTRQHSSSNERKIPEFVGGSEFNTDLDEIASDISQANQNPVVKPPAAAVQLTDEEKAMILVDDMSISRPDDYDPAVPRRKSLNLVQSRGREELQFEETKSGGYDSPIIGTPTRETTSDNASRLYQAQSEHSLVNRIESFRNQSNGSFGPNSAMSASQSFHQPNSSIPPAFNTPNGLAPQEVMEINRLMSIGYSYEAALGMLGINLSASMYGTPPTPPVPYPIPMMSPMPVPVMVPPGYYPPPPMPMMASPYQSYYTMPPPSYPPARSSGGSFRGEYYQDNDADLMLAMQRSLEEEERRKQSVTNEELMVKEAVERANERAIQIALQRSFEEQYGEGSYARYQQEQLNRAMPNQQMHPVSSMAHETSPRRIATVGSIDFNMIHNYGSVDIDESNPLRDDMMFDNPQYSPPPIIRNPPNDASEDRPGAYHHSPTRLLNNRQGATGSPVTQRQQSGSMYDVPTAQPVNEDGSVGSGSQGRSRTHIPSFRGNATITGGTTASSTAMSNPLDRYYNASDDAFYEVDSD